jgi:hypothetical protein
MPNETWLRDDDGDQAVLQSLAIDAITVEVSHALAGRRVRTILLKGPTIARWLYPHGPSRTYTDTDLLVAPNSLDQAIQTLEGIGFIRPRPIVDDATIPHEHAWDRGLFRVDLDTTLYGVGVDANRFWAIATSHSEPFSLGGCSLDAFDCSMKALHVALHAAKHGYRAKKPMGDLDAALSALTRADWERVGALAQECQAVPAFVIGLELHPRGRALVQELGLKDTSGTKEHLRAASASSSALAWSDFGSAHSFATRARIFTRKIFPSVSFMRWAYPIAGRGPAGLLAAYVLRVGSVLRRAPAAYIEWRRLVRRTPRVKR